MNGKNGFEGVSPGQYRTFLVGFTIPLVGALFGIVFPGLVMVTGDIRGNAFLVLGPGFFVAGWVQIELYIMNGRNPIRITGARRRIHRLLLVPMMLVPPAILTSLVGVLTIRGEHTDDAYFGLIASVIGALFLPFTARARRMHWLQS